LNAALKVLVKIRKIRIIRTYIGVGLKIYGCGIVNISSNGHINFKKVVACFCKGIVVVASIIDINWSSANSGLYFLITKDGSINCRNGSHWPLIAGESLISDVNFV
jgi:hypothetical protein